MNWRLDYVEDGITLPEPKYPKSLGGLEIPISSVKKEDLENMDYYHLRDLFEMLKDMTDDVRLKLADARLELHQKLLEGEE